jgi:hypothetical protein
MRLTLRDETARRDSLAAQPVQLQLTNEPTPRESVYVDRGLKSPQTPLLRVEESTLAAPHAAVA